MKHKLPKFLTEKHINIGDELNKLFMINNTQSLFVQYGDRVECVYMSYGNEKFERCHYERNGIFVIEHYICEPQFRSLYRKFLDNEIDCLNYEDIKLLTFTVLSSNLIPGSIIPYEDTAF